MSNSKKIWITWEVHQRTRTLCREFNLDLVELTYTGTWLLRIFLLSIKTLIVIVSRRPRLLWVQNPSMILSTIAVILRPIFRYKLIVDRHSSFKFPLRRSRSWKYRIYHALSDYTIRGADHTVVTNQPLASFVELLGGNPAILPDKLPYESQRFAPRDCGYFVFVSSMSDDEPLQEMIEAFRGLPDETLYITGNYRKAILRGDDFLLDLPENIHLCGFVPEEKYEELVAEAHGLIVITKFEFTLTCGAYESVAYEKPMILGDTRTIRKFFSEGAVYTKTDPVSLKDSIAEFESEFVCLKKGASNLKVKLSDDWASLSKNIEALM